jgi:hypothetical protein
VAVAAGLALLGDEGGQGLRRLRHAGDEDHGGGTEQGGEAGDTTDQGSGVLLRLFGFRVRGLRTQIVLAHPRSVSFIDVDVGCVPGL